ncbi:MAG: hypothetical protein BA870_11885 [Desulfuromonadales bacterium C00003094]|nr:MAG: hypothetical protein BA870_11885 [Desulfuromonadales bacterium C00003094]
MSFQTGVLAIPVRYLGETVEKTMMNMKEEIEAHPLALKEDGEEMPNKKSLLLEWWKSVRGFTKIVLDIHSKGLNGVGKVIKGSKVLIMSLMYKENVPDTRGSPVREIVTVAHDEFKETGFMAMDETSVLADMREMFDGGN